MVGNFEFVLCYMFHNTYLLLSVRKTIFHRICICMNILNGFGSFVYCMFVVYKIHLILSLFTFDEDEKRICIQNLCSCRKERETRHDCLLFNRIRLILFIIYFDLSFLPRSFRFVFVILLRLYTPYTMQIIIIIIKNWCYGCHTFT